MQVAEERFGLTGLTVDPDAEPGTAPVAAAEAPAGPYDALLEAAVQALDAGDFGGAVQAYKNVLSDDPGNTEAKLGLAQAELLQRVQGADPQQVRKDAAEKPGDVPAQIAAADLDLVGGHVEDAFGRLIDTVQRTAGDDRDAVRRAAARALRGGRRRRSAGDRGAQGAGPGSVLTGPTGSLTCC